MALPAVTPRHPSAHPWRVEPSCLSLILTEPEADLWPQHSQMGWRFPDARQTDSDSPGTLGKIETPSTQPRPPDCILGRGPDMCTFKGSPDSQFTGNTRGRGTWGMTPQAAVSKFQTKLMDKGVIFFANKLQGRAFCQEGRAGQCCAHLPQHHIRTTAQLQNTPLGNSPKAS